MIRSMTGFGRCEVSDDQYKLLVEMKSVNHRYLDLSFKMPKKFYPWEAKIRQLLKQDVLRGKVDVYITFEAQTDKGISIKYNETLANEYMELIDRVSEQFHIAKDIQAATLLRFPEILTTQQTEDDEDELYRLLESAVKKVLEQFIDSREIEGNRLKSDLLLKLADMKHWVDFIETNALQCTSTYKQRLEDKVKELLTDSSLVDENRILTEVTLYADKICVDEETVRLKSHIEEMEKTIQSGGGVGRKLDFIAQEMNREANTILSKSNDLNISNVAINLKTEIEKVREQIQNIE